jgi:hypothetical protein
MGLGLVLKGSDQVTLPLALHAVQNATEHDSLGQQYNLIIKLTQATTVSKLCTCWLEVPGCIV